MAVLLGGAVLSTHAASGVLDEVPPVRGFCIAAPSPPQLDEFIKFIREELAPRSVNTLILRVDYNYQFASRPSWPALPGSPRLT